MMIRRLINSTIFFLILFMKKCTCDQSCKYYPNYPNTTTKIALCSNGCCGGDYPLNIQDACCLSSTPSWIVFLIVGIVVSITVIVCVAFLCIKCHKKQQNAQKIAQQTWATRVSGVQMINRNSSDMSQPPPKYDEIQFNYPTNSQMIELQTIDNRQTLNGPPNRD